MDFMLKGSSAPYKRGFCELLTERGYACESGIEVELKQTEDAVLCISFDGEKAQITAPQTAFLFRGLMTLVMKLEKDEHSPIEEKEQIYFEKNGAMLDCSRNCVMSIAAVKAWIRMQAAVGMNMLMLYTEDTYEVPEYPYFGAFRGRYKKEELKELDQYAKIFGIELVPCIQTLGHLQQPLRWPVMKKMRDTSDILKVGDEEVYKFIRACLKQISECFTTRRVHLGMDEAWTLGLGKYLVENGFKGKDQIMKEHLAKIMEICEEFDLEPMMWSDMFFRVHSATEDYYDVPFDTDMRTKELPPAKMGLVYWDYYHLDEEYYRAYIKLHRQITDHVIFAGGGWSWNGTSPNIKTGYGVTHAALRACKKEQVEEVIFTLWGDDATETPVYSAVGPVLLCAEYGFGENPDEQKIREKFEFLTGSSYDAYRVLGDFDIWTKETDPEHFCPDPSKTLLFQDVMMGLYDGQMENVPVGAYYAELGSLIEKKNSVSAETADRNTFWGKEMQNILTYYHTYADVLAVKADLGLRLRSAYLADEEETLRKICEEDLKKAMELVEQMRRQREHLWMSEGRVFGWEVLDIRFRALIGRMESAKERLESYLCGKLESLPELEEERIMIRPELSGEKRHCCAVNSWVNTASASPIAWGWLPQ